MNFNLILKKIYIFVSNYMIIEVLNSIKNLEHLKYQIISFFIIILNLKNDNLGQPTQVTCEIFIRSIGSINPESMDYEVDLYLRQSWFDPRLNTGNGSRALDLNDPKLVQMIWKPEVFFANAKTAEFQYVTVPNVLVRLETGGHILYMLR